MLLNNILKDINFVVLRNFQNLHKIIPEYPDDVDILTDNYDKILKTIKPYLVRIDNPNVGHILQIDNKLIKLDIRVIGDNYYCSEWETSMIQNKVLFNNFYILDKNNYKYSILYHCLIHKPEISKKYFNFIKSEFDTVDKNKLFLLLEKFMYKKSYGYKKPKDLNCFYNNYKKTRMLFLIRKNGLLRHSDIIKKTQDILLENNYSIYEEGLITIKDKKNFLQKLYGDKINNKELKDSINNANTNMCYYFITDYNNYKQNSGDIKKKLRSLYPNPANIHWNYFHSSDSIDDAYKEIDILKSNQLEFCGVGTYYNQKSY